MKGMRKPVVAFQFYEGDPDLLEKQLDILCEPGLARKKALAIVSPHAGYIYSGKVAGAVYSRIEPTASYVVIGPNHRGFGSNAGIMSEGSWLMPWGKIELDSDLAEMWKTRCDLITEDSMPHQYEHSGEVQLPFIHRIAPTASLVPLSLLQNDYAELEQIGLALGAAILESGKTVTIVASTDFSHYEPYQVAQRKDRPAIDAILALDPKGLQEYKLKSRLTMCGVGPTIVSIVAAKALGAHEAELIQYATSGEVSGDYQQVVGYAGLIIA
jgi:MEMO1 family protein